MKYLSSSNYVRNSFGLIVSLQFEILRQEIKSKTCKFTLFICLLFMFIYIGGEI